MKNPFEHPEMVTHGWLMNAGITSMEILKEMGSASACFRLYRMIPDRVSLNLLWGLEGLIQGKPWTEISDQEKKQLIQELRAYGWSGQQ